MHAQKLFAFATILVAVGVIAHPVSTPKIDIELTSPLPNDISASIIADITAPALQVEKRSRKEHDEDVYYVDGSSSIHANPDDRNGDGDLKDHGEPEYVASPRIGPDDYSDVNERTSCLMLRRCMCPKRVKEHWKHQMKCVFTLGIKCPKLDPHVC